MTVQDLRDVLREQAETPSPANPYRHEQVRSRIRRTRLRRRVTAGAAVVAAVAVGVYLIPGAVAAPERGTTAAQTEHGTAAAGLPESFTSRDGTRYRRLATATLKKNGEAKTSVKVPVSGKPLDVAAACDGDGGSPAPNVSVNGRDDPKSSFAPCEKGMFLRPLTMIEPGATEATVTFDTITYGSPGCGQEQGGTCGPVVPEQSTWRLAVYEWTPPARPVQPERGKALPARLAGWKLARSATGVSDRDRSFSLVVKSESGKVAIDQLCTGDLATRTWFTYQVGLEKSAATATCAVWKTGPFPMAMAEFRVPKGERVTITGRLGVLGESTNRPVRWSAGVYVR
ncbi:hypothetical protein [Nonomuraea sp. NPDC049400]|uniref:hypothetical protein n=1 Tax=Nonomuraea sp. NPDC049400 TaxID=3364352 RepID=UPI0037AEA99E